MESEWRQNVIYYGWNGSGVELIARYLDSPLELWGKFTYAGVTYQWRAQRAPGMEVPMTYTLDGFPPASHPHFPYGVDVSPDHP